MSLVAAFLVATSWVVTRITSDHLMDQVDAQLVRFASGPGGGPKIPPSSTGLPRAGSTSGRDSGTYSSIYAGVVVDGVLETRLLPESGAVSSSVPSMTADKAIDLARSGTIETVSSTVKGSRYRVMAGVDFDGNIIVLGMPLDNVDAAITRLTTTELVTTLSVLFVLGMILWWVLRLGVRPVRRMTEAAATIAAGDLSHRVPEEAPGTEAHELGVALNAMLEHIEAAFAERTATEDKLRRFVADASHELRTPVTTVRGYAELYRMGGLDNPDRLDAAMVRTEAEAIRMGRLVEDLLTLARLDQHQHVKAVPVRVDRVATDAVSDLRVRHPDHPVAERVEAATVMGNPDQLHQVIANLLTNAAVHTPVGTPVEVEVAQRDGRVRLTVRDHGPGMDDAAISQAFERFWRSDPSRSRASGGSGLGLSIVAAIVESMGGTVRLERPVDGQGTMAVIELPIAELGPGAPGQH